MTMGEKIKQLRSANGVYTRNACRKNECVRSATVRVIN